jgi:hypothetical protein
MSVRNGPFGWALFTGLIIALVAFELFVNYALSQHSTQLSTISPTLRGGARPEKGNVEGPVKSRSLGESSANVAE